MTVTSIVTAVRVIGIDPGPTPGLVLIRYSDGRLVEKHVVQCTHEIAPEVLRTLLDSHPDTLTIVQVESFVVGRRSGRSSSAKAGTFTRDLIGALGAQFDQYQRAPGRMGGRLFQRNASQVKFWATDKRLERAGLLNPTLGMRHARDAARHALFAAVHDGGIPDPLSKRSNP